MDYEAVPSTSWLFTELEQEGSLCFNITIEDDAVVEDPEECFIVSLSNPTAQANLILDPAMASVCIIDNCGMLSYQTICALRLSNELLNTKSYVCCSKTVYDVSQT